MDLVNIAVRARLHEPGYRYKRERIRVVQERFNGYVTRLTNVATIARQLQVTADDLEKGLLKHTKRKLAISTCKRLTFPGVHDAAVFDDVLQDMIEKFVLCPKCQLPEWDRKSCNACGHTSHGAPPPPHAKTTAAHRHAAAHAKPRSAATTTSTKHRPPRASTTSGAAGEEAAASARARGHSSPADDVNLGDDEIASLLHRLYDLRGQALERSDASTVSRVDSLLTLGWNWDSCGKFEEWHSAVRVLSTQNNL